MRPRTQAIEPPRITERLPCGSRSAAPLELGRRCLGHRGVDPEINDAGQPNFSVADFLTQPPVRYFLARINVTF